MNGQKQLLDISWGTVFRIFLIGFLFYALFLVREILILFFFALMISFLINPAINLLKKIKIPRILGAILVYLSIFGVLGFLVYLASPIFFHEFRQLISSFPDYFQEISPFLREIGIEAQQSLEAVVRDLSGKMEEISAGIFGALSFIFGGFFATLFILVTAFFLSVEDRGFEKFLFLVSPKKYEDYVITIFRRSQKKVSGWFGARALICAFVGLATFLVFLFFDVKYPFMFALLGGIFNFIPYIGPLVAGFIMFIFIVVLDSWWKAVLVVAIFTLIQQIDANILNPVLTGKIIGLPPVLVLISLVLGAQLFGILGVILAIPVAGILYEFLREFLKKRKKIEEENQEEEIEEAAEIL